MKIKFLPVEACHVHLFDTLAPGLLLSLGKTCDTGCIYYFDAKKVYIFFQGKIVLQGVRYASTAFLWKLNKYHNHYQDHKGVQSLNAVIENLSIAERIKFYHAYLFLSTLHTHAKSIDAGYITTFPIITSQQDRKYLPCSKATVKGHFKAINKGLRYDQITPAIINNNTATSSSKPIIIEKYDSDGYQTPPKKHQPQYRIPNHLHN